MSTDYINTETQRHRECTTASLRKVWETAKKIAEKTNSVTAQSYTKMKEIIVIYISAH